MIRGTILAALTAGALAAPGAALACMKGRAELRGPWGQAHVAVTVRDDASERARGLMHVERMDPMVGMLFVYEQPQPVSFWMRNTLIPLDMIFFDRSGTVTRVHEDARPLDETPIFGGDSVLLVLEVNAGIAERLGVGPGTELRHPDVPQEVAAWPCG